MVEHEGRSGPDSGKPTSRPCFDVLRRKFLEVLFQDFEFVRPRRLEPRRQRRGLSDMNEFRVAPGQTIQAVAEQNSLMAKDAPLHPADLPFDVTGGNRCRRLPRVAAAHPHARPPLVRLPARPLLLADLAALDHQPQHRAVEHPPRADLGPHRVLQLADLFLTVDAPLPLPQVVTDGRCTCVASCAMSQE